MTSFCVLVFLLLKAGTNITFAPAGGRILFPLHRRENEGALGRIQVHGETVFRE